MRDICKVSFKISDRRCHIDDEKQSPPSEKEAKGSVESPIQSKKKTPLGVFFY